MISANYNMGFTLSQEHLEESTIWFNVRNWRQDLWRCLFWMRQMKCWQRCSNHKSMIFIVIFLQILRILWYQTNHFNWFPYYRFQLHCPKKSWIWPINSWITQLRYSSREMNSHWKESNNFLFKLTRNNGNLIHFAISTIH